MEAGAGKSGVRAFCAAAGKQEPAQAADWLISKGSEGFVVKLRVREKESIQEAVGRFRKLVEHSGVKKEMRRREYYEKPSDQRRRARRRAERRARMARQTATP